MKFHRTVIALAGLALASLGPVVAVQTAQAAEQRGSGVSTRSALSARSVAVLRTARHEAASSRVPGPVHITGVSLRNSGTGLVVNWLPATGATGYHVEWKDADSGETLPADTNSSQNYSFIGLRPGTHTYVVSITPFNRRGDGPTATAERTATGRPGPVHIIGFSLRGAGTILEVDWLPATGATGYHVGWKDAGTGETVPADTSGNSSTIGLKAGTHTYVVSITPFNDAGDGLTATAERTATGRTS